MQIIFNCILKFYFALEIIYKYQAKTAYRHENSVVKDFSGAKTHNMPYCRSVFPGVSLPKKSYTEHNFCLIFKCARSLLQWL